MGRSGLMLGVVLRVRERDEGYDVVCMMVF